MAITYPRTLLDADVKTGSERKVFDLLRSGLPDDWEVFHSAGWVAGGNDFGEIDFVLSHPDQGVLCLEVKGGGIECRHGEWFRVEAGAEPERIRDPFEQAVDNRFALERLLEETRGWNGRKPLLGHAVAFPYITIHQLALAPDAPRDLLLDRHDIEDPGPALERVLAFHRGGDGKAGAPGQDAVGALRELLSPTVSIEVPLAAHFTDEEAALIELTHEQSMALERLKLFRRLAVRGCAGSGKTMLAIEHARRLATGGKRVAFVCFNRALRDHLRNRYSGDGLHINTFHGLCFHLASKGKVELPQYDEAPPQHYWEDQLPDALVSAVDELGDQFDALIVDEAQDLAGHWLTALMSTLADEQNAPVWLFMDDNQRVYDARLNVPPEFEWLELDVNCRNTRLIHEEVMKLYEGDVTPRVRGPEGRPVEFHPSTDQAATVAGVIERFCGSEEVPPQDLVVLSSHAPERSAVAGGLPGAYRPTDQRGKLGKHVFFSSIRAFKGLESPVVILCELEDIDDMTQNQQLYVAISRARNHCVVVAPPAE